jgi:hypothetical protein
VRKRRFNPHRVITQIKYWSIEITVLILFLKWLGGSVWHELGLPDLLVTAAQAAERKPSATSSCPTSP